MPRITHVELWSDSPEDLESFYSDVFGWMIHKKEAGSDDYWFMVSGGMNQAGGINAGMKRQSGALHWVPTIQVDSVDSYLEKVVENGGEIAEPKRAVTATGYMAYCKDPKGNLFAVLEKDSSVA